MGVHCAWPWPGLAALSAWRSVVGALGLASLLGCASGLPPAGLPEAAPPRWQAAAPASVAVDTAALPHGGSLEQLLAWWRGQGDPLLLELIEAGQRVSPSVASAGSRLAQARAVRVSAGADLAPSLDVAGSASRGRNLLFPGNPPITSTSARLGLQTSWELDVFGGMRANREAASERLLGAQADWHEARVSMAAEVAVQYDLLRQCRQLADITARDAASRIETARLAQLSTQAGFMAPAVAALARASAADAKNRALAQAAQCELDIKALVALTAWPEAQLRSRLAGLPLESSTQFPALQLHPVPAQAVAQRPDVFSAERAVLAARADIAGVQAQRLPRLALSGFIGGSSLRAGGNQTDAATWSLGPLSLSLPVWDSGRRAAQVDAARVRHDEAASRYAAQVRQAVREVESALVQLQSAAERGPQVQAAAEGFRSSLHSTQARYDAGLASLVELEDARRQMLAADTALAQWRTAVRAANVSLYRAVGGGWSPALLVQAASQVSSQ